MVDILYHYTSKTGLLGIIRDKCLWATNILYLSDAAEFSYTLEVSSKVLDTKMKDKTLTENESKLILKIYEVVQGNREFHIPNTYVACFSEDGDSLSQWRAYCPKTGGFSIGFNYEYLRSLASDQNYKLIECVYDEEPQSSHIKSKAQTIVEDIITKYRGQASMWAVKGKDLEHTIMDTASHFFYDLASVAPEIKDKSFEEEKEWRVVSPLHCLAEHSVLHREGPSMIVPYREFKLVKDGQPMQIGEIVIGPTPHPTLASWSLWTLYTSSGVEIANARNSIIPYRAW